jgi:hypothetical protein
LHRSCSKACRNTQFLKCINWPHIFCGSKSGCHYSDTKFRPHTAFRSSHFVGHNHSTPPSPHANPSPLHKRVWPSNAPCDTTHANQHPHRRGHVPHTHLATTQQTPPIRVASMFRLLCLASLALLTHCEEKKLAPCPYETLYKKSKTVPGAEVVTFGEPPNTLLALSDTTSCVGPRPRACCASPTSPGFGPRRTHAFWVMAQRAILNTHACGCWREM